MLIEEKRTRCGMCGGNILVKRDEKRVRYTQCKKCKTVNPFLTEKLNQEKSKNKPLMG